jgi:pilus assembly protein CpaB
MKSRGGLVLGLALVLAVAATGAVFLYVRGVQREATGQTGRVTVIVAKQDIPAGTKLDPLVSGGAFTTMAVTKNTVIPGAVTSLSQLQGQTTAQPILEGEQITALRLHGGASEDLGGGVLGIPPGYTAVTLQLDAANAGSSALQQSDHVTVYGSFDQVGEAKATLNGKVTQSGTNVTGNVNVSQAGVPGVVLTLVPDTQILKVSAVSSEPDAKILVTMALKPQDSARVVFAEEQGRVWLALLPPDQQGSTQPPVTFTQVAQ